MGLFANPDKFGELRDAILKTPFVMTSDIDSSPIPPPPSYYLLDDSGDYLLDDSEDKFVISL